MDSSKDLSVKLKRKGFGLLIQVVSSTQCGLYTSGSTQKAPYSNFATGSSYSSMQGEAPIVYATCFDSIRAICTFQPASLRHLEKV